MRYWRATTRSGAYGRGRRLLCGQGKNHSGLKAICRSPGAARDEQQRERGRADDSLASLARGSAIAADWRRERARVETRGSFRNHASPPLRLSAFHEREREMKTARGWERGHPPAARGDSTRQDHGLQTGAVHWERGKKVKPRAWQPPLSFPPSPSLFLSLSRPLSGTGANAISAAAQQRS